MSAEIQPFLVRFPRDLHAQATACAQAEDRTLASLIRLAVRRYITDIARADVVESEHKTSGGPRATRTPQATRRSKLHE